MRGLPEVVEYEIDNYFKNRASETRRSVEVELVDVVTAVASEEERLPDNLAEAVDSLALLDDDELWRAARNRLSEEERAQLESLNFKQQSGKLASAERESLAQLVEQYDHAMLLRAEAARLLKERGHDISKLLTRL